MREAMKSRQTKETKVDVSLCLDGGEVDISTGIGFFDHMLEAFAVHSGFGLKIAAQGDLHVDAHHTVEDIGIVLGQAFSEALGDKMNISRYGSFYIPMDESLAFAAVDVSGRAYLVFNCIFDDEKIGDFDSCLCKEFFRAFAFHAGITLHIKLMYGDNSHHKAEAIFKAAAHALGCAVKETGISMTTKGAID